MTARHVPSRNGRAHREEAGVMKWYNSMRGFASSARIREADIFVHATVLERSGIMGLAEGQRVAVDVANGQKGPEALGLRLI
jgi:CspA family cold shock protein